LKLARASHQKPTGEKERKNAEQIFHVGLDVMFVKAA